MAAVARTLTRSLPRAAFRANAQPTFRFAAAKQFSMSARALEKRYTEDHEWIDLPSGQSIATVGISTYAAKALGDVVYVELPTVDTEVTLGDSIGAVESVKSASDILTPVTGKVVEANSALEEQPSTINKSPEGDGWVAKIEVTNAAELEGLMDEAAYKSFSEEADS
ncbi:hypothetical protein K431DRAFT_304913 [Polychaeton citri CBS 116435]|uniref:Glycine cleavage system H protein n=1 Tax=Polychaeton citri CBS 116435 TaxID=1314669 RepID=A0A9P4Q7C2_9PEZI|nr:hypothetical protein K431DRAFT_304913 [Polychaeton citri CBS 116435]